MTDPDIIAGLLEIVAILWTPWLDRLKVETYGEIFIQYLIMIVTRSVKSVNLGIFSKYFTAICMIFFCYAPKTKCMT